jgi:hypothetical protein
MSLTLRINGIPHFICLKCTQYKWRIHAFISSRCKIRQLSRELREASKNLSFYRELYAHTATNFEYFRTILRGKYPYIEREIDIYLMRDILHRERNSSHIVEIINLPPKGE